MGADMGEEKIRSLSDEQIRLMSETRKGSGNPFFGRKHSEASLAKMCEARAGNKNAFYGKTHSDESKRKMSETRKGMNMGSSNPIYGTTRSKETRKKISENRVMNGVASKEKNPNWRGGISKGRKAEMSTTRYKEWRLSVFSRDGNVCSMCGKTEGVMSIHHVKPWKTHPELRYDPSNGCVVCTQCHRTTFKITKESM